MNLIGVYKQMKQSEKEADFASKIPVPRWLTTFGGKEGRLYVGTDDDPLESPKYFHATKTLKNAEREILDQKLYIAVLEGELGPEKTESAKNKLDALKAIGSDMK